MNSKATMDRQYWQDYLAKTEPLLNFHEGFKFLYCPWDRLNRFNKVFVSLNPGRPPDNADLRCVSDERGNSYVIEKHITKSKITHQFLALCDFIATDPEEILTGVAAPFRSNGWDCLTPLQKEKSLEIGRTFWQNILSNKKIKSIIAVSAEAVQLVIDVLNATIIDEFNAGWGNQKIRIYAARSGTRIVHLPHLSRFGLFGRPESTPPLIRALR